MLTTTFDLLRQHDACENRYHHLRSALRERGHRGRIPLSLILEVNGLDDAIWALRAVPKSQAAERDRIARLFACGCAEAVLPIFEREHPDDERPRKAIETARRFVVGDATGKELAEAGAAACAARAATRAAAWDAASAASVAAGAAAWAARAAFYASAGDAARAATCAVAQASVNAASAAEARKATWAAAWDSYADMLRAYLEGTK